jgi:hypothetical protein
MPDYPKDQSIDALMQDAWKDSESISAPSFARIHARIQHRRVARARRAAVRKTYITGLLCGIFVSATAVASIRTVRIYLLPVHSSTGIELQPLPVDENDNSSATFIDQQGHSAVLRISPDMVDSSNVIQDLQWNVVEDPPPDSDPDKKADDHEEHKN